MTETVTIDRPPVAKPVSTALIEDDIWCEKIRGCSCGQSNTSA